MHMFKWFFYYICLNLHDIVTCGPLKGVLAFLCKLLTSESLIVEVKGHFDLHLGKESHRLDDALLYPLGNLDEVRCLWRHLSIPTR
jgi:hypothetical protein